jgi:bifunctional non-homologous end joining protein LigD
MARSVAAGVRAGRRTIDAVMTDQLALPLDAAADRLPELPALRPMLAYPLSDAFDSSDHLFEPWWGGERALLAIGPGLAPGTGDVRIIDAAGVDRSAALPELAGTGVRVAARSALLDGEIVVVDAEGRADPSALAQRLDGGGGRSVAFLAFDLLHLDGRSLLGRPLVRRREALRRVLRPGDEVVAVPAIATEGRALFEAIVAQGLAGMMARQRQGPYLPGVRSRLWRFIPARAGDVPAAELAAAPAEPGTDGAATGPVLALLSRLPLDLED